MRLLMLLFSLCLGVVLVAWWPALPAWVSILALPGCFLFFCLALASGALLPGQWRWLALCFIMLAGHCWALDWAVKVIGQRLPDAWVREDIWVRGQVSSLVEPALRGQRFMLTVHDVCLRLLPDQCGWQSSPLSGATIDLRDYSGLPLLPGQNWRLRLRLRPVHGQANPGGFDLERQRFAQGITTQGYVRDTAFNQVSPHDVSLVDSMAAQILRWRQAIVGQLASNPTLQYPQLLSALITGADQGLDNATWDLLAITGTTHLLVVSGLHVGLIATITYLLCRFLLRFVPRLWPALLCWQPAQRLAACAAIVVAFTYSMLAGFSLPTQRAVVMTMVLLLGRSGRYRLRSSQSLMLAATLVLLINPLAIWQAGFWMSFVAVAALLLAMTGYRRRDPRWQGVRAAIAQWSDWLSRWGWYVLRPQLVISVALLVPLLAGPGTLSLVSPLSNLLAVPLMGVVIVPMALAGAVLGTLSPALGHVCWWLADVGINLLWQWLTLMAALVSKTATVLAVMPDTWQPTAAPGLVAWGLAMLGGLILLLPRGMLPRLPAFMLFLPLIWPTSSTMITLDHGEVAVTVIDVGQGLSVLLQTAQGHVLYDTGPPGGEGERSARRILPILERLGVKQLDAVIISHWHDDHAGALPGLLPQLPIGVVLYGGQLPAPYETTPLHTAEIKLDLMKNATAPDWLSCHSQTGWQRGGVNFEFLHPPGEATADSWLAGNTNNTSCVLRVSNARETLLLTGDIEAVVERDLLVDQSGRLAADWLMAAHHGSNTSSTGVFLDAVSPQCLLVSAGAYNRFNHPHPDVIARAQVRDICVLNTADSGALQRVLPVTAENEAADVENHPDWRAFRQENPRFWRAPPLP